MIAGLRRAAFLDRDGVLNIDKGYVFRPDDVEWVAGAKEAVRTLNEAGWLAIVVTNQSGIARGMYSVADFERLMAWMQADLKSSGAHLDAWYVCPHHPTAGEGELTRTCNCRKPEPGLLIRAAKEHGIGLSDSIMVGDKERDIDAGRAAGVMPFLFEGGNLNDFVRTILANLIEGS